MPKPMKLKQVVWCPTDEQSVMTARYLEEHCIPIFDKNIKAYA